MSDKLRAVPDPTVHPLAVLAERHVRSAARLMDRATLAEGLDRQHLIRRAEAHALIGASLARVAALNPPTSRTVTL